MICSANLVFSVFRRLYEAVCQRCEKTQKRGKNLEKFKIIAETLVRGELLDEIHRNHKLIGNFSGRNECHLESDWLLIYKVTEDQIIFERTGSHSDLFNK